MTDQLDEYREALLAALLAGDSAAARAALGRMRADMVAPADIYLRVFTPCMITIGELWERNQLTVAEEHLATAITERLIMELSPSFEDGSLADAQGTALIGCVAGERHVLGARMLADLLRTYGWRVLDMGADVPSHDWVKLALRFNVDLVALSVNMSSNLLSAQSLIAELRAASPSLFVLVGGAVFAHEPDLWRKLGANLYHPDPLAAVALASANAALRLDAQKDAPAEL